MSATKKKCGIPSCGGRHHGRGLCKMHYERWRRHGDPLTVINVARFNRGKWIRDHVLYPGNECLFPPFDLGRCAIVRAAGKQIRASRYMCILAHGEPEDPGLLACHVCRGGATGCVNPRHLYWGTFSQNMMDKVRDGTHSRGSRQGASKLTESDVLEIRRAARNGIPQRVIAERYGVSRQAIGSIARREKWAWLHEKEASAIYGRRK